MVIKLIAPIVILLNEVYDPCDYLLTSFVCIYCLYVCIAYYVSVMRERMMQGKKRGKVSRSAPGIAVGFS